MFNQHKIYRVFRLINFLRAQPPKSIRNIAVMLETSERTVYRYVDMLTDIGFEVQKDGNGKLFIPGAPYITDNTFTHEESEFLRQLLLTAGKDHLLSHAILQKVTNGNDLKTGTEISFSSHLSSVVQMLSEAIQKKQQALLKNYYSAHSQTITDRLVEPVCFTDNYTTLSAYEPATQQNKYFSIERITSVELPGTSVKHSDKHEFFPPDVFGFQGKSPKKEVELELSLRGYLLLKQEYPLTTPYIKPIPGTDKFLFKTKVQSLLAPARFVAGLNGEVVVKGGEELVAMCGK